MLSDLLSVNRQQNLQHTTISQRKKSDNSTAKNGRTKFSKKGRRKNNRPTVLKNHPQLWQKKQKKEKILFHINFPFFFPSFFCVFLAVVQKQKKNGKFKIEQLSVVPLSRDVSSSWVFLLRKFAEKNGPEGAGKVWKFFKKKFG